MFKSLIAMSVFTLCVGTSVTTAHALQAAQSSGDTYTWHGELVSLDAGTRMVTVKTHLLGNVVKEVGGFAVGDRVLLKWSGFDKFADVVNGVTKYDASRKIETPFSFPAELASREVQHDYMTIRFRIPEASIADLRPVKPGEWITVTARQRPASDAQAIVAVNSYVKRVDAGTK